MSRPLLRRGTRGDSVRDLQQLLAGAGYDPGPVDGIFGGGTESAVRAFQAARSLAVDGVVGPATWAALEATPSVAVPTAPAHASAPSSGSAVDWPATPADERMRHVMRLLVETYGYPVNGAAGIVGNLWAESGVIPQRVEGSASATPLRARSFSGAVRDFTAEEVMDRSSATGTGPALPGVGLAQWTSAGRRSGLFAHRVGGRSLGASVLFDMEAQVDYLHHELTTSYSRVHAVVSAAGVSVEDACDEVVYSFEVPGSVLDAGSRLPRTDPRVQAVFHQRRGYADNALRAYQGSPHGGVPAPHGSGHSVLRRGARGPEVLELQTRLVAAGADPGPLDGVFGEKTSAAVESFQQQHGLGVDGVVGDRTWAALESSSAASVVDVLWQDVPLYPQSTDTNCWAAAAAMVAGWDQEASIAFDQAPAPSGIEDAAAWFGLELEPLVSITPQALRELLETKGPLWICANQPFQPGPGFHAVVITGMFGAESADGDGLCLSVLDPWDREPGSPCLPGAHTGTHVRGSRYSIGFRQHLAELEAAVTDNEGWRWVRVMHAYDTRGRRPVTGAAQATVD